jgi:hydrogenase maturation protease
MKTLVLGIGNTLLGDEGAGVHAVRALRDNDYLADAITFLDGGTLSFTLAGAIEDHPNLIVIDAAELGAAPGTVRLYENDAMDDFLGGNRKRSVHEVGLIDLMAIAALTQHLPARRALIGIQPQTLEWGETPSPPVATAIPRACELAHELIRKWQQ